MLNIKKTTTYFILFLLFACKGSLPDLHENTVRVHLPVKTNGLHPTNDIDANRAMIFKYTQRCLIDVDLRTNKRIPLLLTRMPTVNATGDSIYFELKSNVKWDDGTPFTVDDAIFSLKILVCPLVNNPSFKTTYLSIFKSICKDPSNPNGFTLVTQGFHRSNMEIFLDIFMLQKSKWDKQGVTNAYTVEQFMAPDFKPSTELVKWAEVFNNPQYAQALENLVGLGPYKITEWEHDSYMLLEKKKNWWGQNDTAIYNIAFPDKIIFKIILDETALVYAIKNQTIDVVNRITTSRVLKLAKHNYFNKNYNYTFINQYAYTYICLNAKPDGVQNKPLFTSKYVRRAMAHLVPVDDIVKIFSKGQALRMVSCVYPQKKEFNASLKPLPFDVEKAIALLEQEGWKDTDGDNIRDKTINGEKVKFSFKLNYPNMVTGNKEICLLIKDCMYKAGVEMIPVGLDFGQFYQECYNQTFDAALGSWLGSSGYEDFSQLFSTRAWSTHGENFGGFGSAHSDSLLYAMNTERNETKYIEMAKKFQALVYDEQPYIFLISPKNKILMHKRFKNNNAYMEKPNFYLNILKLQTNTGAIKPN